MVLPIGLAIGGGLLVRGLASRWAANEEDRRARARLEAETERRRAILEQATGAERVDIDPITGRRMDQPEWIGGIDPLASPMAGARFGLNLLADPALGEVGAGLLDRYGQIQVNTAAELGRRETGRLGDVAALQRIEREAELRDISRRAAERADMERLRFQEAGQWGRALLEAEMKGAGAGLGAVPGGYQRVMTATGGIADVPLPGTTDYARQVEGINSAVDALNAVDSLSALVRASGTEYGGGTAKRMGILHKRLVSTLAQLGGTGVVSPTEAEEYSKALPNPSSLWENMTLTRSSTILSALDEVAKLVAGRAATYWGTTPEGAQGAPVPDIFAQRMRLKTPGGLPASRFEVMRE